MSPLFEGMELVVSMLLVMFAGAWVLTAAAGLAMALVAWIIWKK